MASSRQVAHIQMFFHFPIFVNLVCLCACAAGWWPLCSPHNITTGVVYTIMTCIARGPATSVAPCSPSLCLSLFLSLFFPLCLSVLACTSCSYFTSSSFISCSFVIFCRFCQSLHPQQRHLVGKKIARLTLQGLNTCLTWHLSAIINKHIIQSQQASKGRYSSALEGLSAQGKERGQFWQPWVGQMSHGVTYAPPTTAQLITNPGGQGGNTVHPKCDHVLTRHSNPRSSPEAVYGEQWPLTQPLRCTMDHTWHLWHCMHPRNASPWCQLISQPIS